MADEDQDDSQKTEDPTQKRLDDAFKRGQVPTSREVTSFVMIIVFTMVLTAFAPFMMKKTVNDFTKYISNPDEYRLDSASSISISIDILEHFASVVIAPIIIFIIVIFISSIVQHGFIFTTEPLMPKLERISILAGVKRIFSMRSFVEFIKGIIKISLIAIVSFMAVYSDLNQIPHITAMNMYGIMYFLSKLVLRIMIGICIVMFFIAIFDFIYQKYEHIKSLRMSKRDLKDEYKQTEGNPEVKAKLNEIRRKRANQRMMADVPGADVVITNPTHYAVALKYDQEKNTAPVVVAKGLDLIALKIREVAKENNVPIVENPPLARLLYKSVDLGREVPFEHYNAVAEVIRYVYKLKGKLKKTG